MKSEIFKSVVFTKHKNLDILGTEHYLSNKKIHWSHIKGYLIARNRFVAEVTFKKMVVLLAKFIILVSWSSICITLILINEIGRYLSYNNV